MEHDMTRILGVLITSAALAGGVLADPLPSEKVPAAVKASFQAKFPGVGKVEWKLKGDQNYEAEFTRDGVEVAAKFDPKGKWLETETAIKESELTEEVRKTIAAEFKGYKIVETQKVERAEDKHILFEVHVENDKEILKVQLDGKGTVVAKSAKAKKAP
jgi:hypothetical protein